MEGLRRVPACAPLACDGTRGRKEVKRDAKLSYYRIVAHELSACTPLPDEAVVRVTFAPDCHLDLRHAGESLEISAVAYGGRRRLTVEPRAGNMLHVRLED
jgi:hypothetical protein